MQKRLKSILVYTLLTIYWRKAEVDVTFKLVDISTGGTFWGPGLLSTRRRALLTQRERFSSPPMQADTTRILTSYIISMKQAQLLLNQTPHCIFT